MELVKFMIHDQIDPDFPDELFDAKNYYQFAWQGKNMELQLVAKERLIVDINKLKIAINISEQHI